MSRESHNGTLEPESPDAQTQSGPAADALDQWLADDTVVAALDEDELEDAAEPTPGIGDDIAPSVAHPWSHLDAVSSWLLRVALVLIIVVLATATSMVLYFMTAEKAPRTAVERDTAAAEIAVRARPSDPSAWQTLTYAYARAGRFDDALETVRRGRESTKEQALLLPEAEVLRIAGRYSDAVPVYDSAIVTLSKEESEAVAARAKQGVAMAAPSAALVRAYFGRALARNAAGDNAGAIEDVLAALDLAPGQASMRVTLGDLYAASDQKDLAKAAYTEALRFIPDDEQALSGLKRLEEGN